MRSTSCSSEWAAYLEPLMTTSTTSELSAGAVPFRFPFTIVEVCMGVHSLPRPPKGAYKAVHIELRHTSQYRCVGSCGRPEVETIGQGLRPRYEYLVMICSRPSFSFAFLPPEFQATIRTSMPIVGSNGHAAFHSSLWRDGKSCSGK